MGNRIGDYIHWKYDNYLGRGIKYGSIEREGSIVKNSAQGIANSVFQEQRRRIQREINARTNTNNKKNIKNELEQKLNFYYNAKMEGDTYQQVGKTDITSEWLMQKILEAFNKTQKGLAVGTSTLDVKLTALSQVIEGRKRNDLAVDTYRTQLESIEHRMTAIHKFYNQLSKKKQTKNIAVLMKDFNQLEFLYQSFLNVTEQIITKSGRKDVKVIDKYGNFAKQVYKSFISQLNLVYKTVKNIALKEALGELAELFATTALVVQQDNIEEQAEKLIMNIFVNPEKYGKMGNQTITPVLVSSNLGISGGSAKNSANGLEYFTHIGPSETVKIHPVKGKVDLKANIAGEDQFLSIKNYNMFDQINDISILNGTSLIKYIQEYTIFTNHYLNIVTTHAEGQVPEETLVKSANQTLLLTMLLKALSGGIMSLSETNNIVKSDMANLFVVNNNKTGKWTVYFIEDMIHYLRNNLSNILQYSTFKINGIKFSEDFKIKQQMVGTYKKGEDNSSEAYSRIYNLLKTLDTYELEVSIKKNLLTLIQDKYLY